VHTSFGCFLIILLAIGAARRFKLAARSSSSELAKSNMYLTSANVARNLRHQAKLIQLFVLRHDAEAAAEVSGGIVLTLPINIDDPNELKY